MAHSAESRTGDIWAASHGQPISDVDRSRVNAYQHVALVDHRLGDLLELEDIR